MMPFLLPQRLPMACSYGKDVGARNHSNWKTNNEVSGRGLT